ncbi:hypothetical protein [Haemophilus haemolyticus]|uniref:hypothetical protein n=1 Tax=Haemophilus haemolyticus TaxID=726 RepID=UPI0012908013|nr:hypothetical protein [Haemophilus haemolyticus]
MSKIQFSFYRVDSSIKEDFLRGIEKNKFSFAMNTYPNKDIKGNSIFIIELDDEIYLSNSSSKRQVTSIESAITLSNFKKLTIHSTEEIQSYLSKRSKNTFLEKISFDISAFSEGLNKEIYNYFLNHHKQKIDSVLKSKKTFNNHVSFMQDDAIHFAISIAKLDSSFRLESVEIKEDKETELIHLSEDHVINFDTKSDIQGLSGEMYITGKAIYRNESEELIIYTANKNPLENLLGVDLIYINNIQKNMVMVQYKILEKEGDSWIFRDNNNQLRDEVERMNRVKEILNDNSKNEYRLNPSPFFLRFIKRQSSGNNPVSFCISLDHYQQIMNQPVTLGPRGGRRIGYDEMQKHYIGKSELEGLIRSGYVGTYSQDTDNIHEIIHLISSGKQNDGLVIAFKNRLSGE